MIMIELDLAKLSYRFVKKELPLPITRLFTANVFNHNYNTRARNDPRAPRHHSSKLHKSFLNKSQSVWSKLDTAMKNSKKFETLKNLFVKSRTSQY